MARKRQSVFDVRASDARRTGARGASFAPDLYWWIVSGSREAREAKPPFDEHPFHEIICAVEGEGVVEIGRTRHDAGPGNVFIVNPGEKHRDYPRGDASFGVQYLAFACAKRWRATVSRATGRDVFPTRIDGARAALVELFDALQHELAASSAFYERVISAHLDAFLFKALRSLGADGADGAAKVAPRVAELVGRLLERMPPGRVSVDEMAEHCFLSRSYFTKVFKKETGESPARFVLRRRVAEAEKLLARTDDTVGAIAHRLGFEDEFYFSKVFKRLVGVSPSRFRNTK